MGVLYIEVNNVNFANAGCYRRQSNEQPLFDFAIIFAANINFHVAEQRAVLYFNPNVVTVFDNVETYVRPLQDQGIKVLLSILGNHQGAGISNFPTVEAARDFAVQLNEVVRRYGLDGIDFDDEYAGYGNNGSLLPYPDSFLWLLRELRQLMPDKIITFYFYGPASSRLGTGELIAGDYLDYSWNALYGTFSVPSVPKLTNEQLGPAAVWVGRSSQSTAENLAQRTRDGGYGVYLYYDMPNEDSNSYLSGVSDILYRSASLLTPDCLLSWPPKGTPAAYGPRESMRQKVSTY